MRKALLSSLILVATWVATPAQADRNWNNYGGNQDYPEYRYEGFHEVQRIRAKLHHDREERQRALWAYNEARRVGDWTTMRYEQARLERLDRRIERREYQLRRAKEQARRDGYEHRNEWRTSYDYHRN